MKKYMQLLMMFMGILLLGCSTSIEPASPGEAEKIKAANQVRIEANDHARSRNYWAALASFEKAEELYSQTDHPSSYWSQYLLHRTKASMTDRVQYSGIAGNRVDIAIEWLEKTKEAGIELDNSKRKIDFEAELVSMLAFKSQYLSHDKQYVAANEIIGELLDRSDIKLGLKNQLKNRVGKNLMELFAFDEAYKAFDEILKPSNLKPELRAHYLQNRAQAAFNIGDRNQAFVDIAKSIEINESFGESRAVYAFTGKMHLGEFYIHENQGEKAMDSFMSAIEEPVRFKEDPDLFKIYSLTWTASKMVGSDDSFMFKRKFDSLTSVHTNLKERYTPSEQQAKLEAGLLSYNQKGIELTERNRNITMWVVFGGVSILLFLLLYIRFKTVSKGKSNSIDTLTAQI